MAAIQSGFVDIDVAARQAQVVGEGPRIAPLSVGDMTAAQVDMCIAIRASIGVETNPALVPEYMRTMIRHPDIFRCQMEMGTALFMGAIPARERELAVLRVGWLCGAPYEWGQHVEIAQRYGLTADEIDRVTRGSSDPAWGAHDRAILRGVEEMLGDAAIAQGTWDVLAATWNEAQLIEFPMMVGQYVATAYVQNSLRVRLVDSNPGLTRRASGGARDD